MLKSLLKTLFVSLISAFLLVPSIVSAKANTEYREGEIIVKLKAQTSKELLASPYLNKYFQRKRRLFGIKSNRSLNKFLNRKMVSSIEPLFEKRFLQVQRSYIKELKKARVLRKRVPSRLRSSIKVKPVESIEATVINKKRKRLRIKGPKITGKEVSTLSNVYKIKLNPQYHKRTKHIVNELNKLPQVEYAELNYLLKANYAPNDPDYPNQWGMNNTGQLVNGAVNALVGADIDAEAAWDITKGSEDVIIAVVDSGVSPHEDFGDRLLEGENYVSGGGSNGQGDLSDVLKDGSVKIGHGTPAAGIAAASGDNDTGVAGMCWNCKILPVKVIDSEGNGTSGDVSSGIYYAGEYIDTEYGLGNGKNLVISLSFGTDGTTINSVKNAVDNAEYFDTLVVASRGNYRKDNPTTPNIDESDPHLISEPAHRPNVLSVGAMNPCGERKDKSSSDCEKNGAWGSRYESSDNGGVQPNGALDFVAPGAYIHTTSKNGGYTSKFDGTSAAAPFVSGVAGLLLSVDPSLKPADVRQLLRDSAVDLGTPGWDGETGHGRVSAAGALNLLCAQKPSLSACQTVEPDPEADLSVTAEAPAEAELNTSVAYTSIVTNNGPNTAEGVSIQIEDVDTIAATIDSIVLGTTDITADCTTDAAVTTCSLNDLVLNEAADTITLNLTPTESGTLTYKFSVSSTVIDPNETNNSAEASVAVAEPIPEADVNVSATGTASILVGEEITYVVNVGNSGPDTAEGVGINFTYPTLSHTVNSIKSGGQDLLCGEQVGFTQCGLQTLASGETKEVMISINALEQGEFVSSFEVITSTLENNTDNNTDSVSTNVEPLPIPKADLQIEHVKLDLNDDFSNPRHTLKVTNNGPDTAEAVSFVFDPQHSFSLNSVKLDAADITTSCTVTETVTCDLGDFASEQIQNVVIDLFSTETVDTNSSFIVSSSTEETDPANNSVAIAVMVSAAPFAPITATTSVYNGDVFEGSVDGSGGAYVTWDHLDGLGETFDKYHIKFKKKAVTNFDDEISYAKSFVDWNGYNWIGLTPGDIWSFQIVPVIDNDPDMNPLNDDRWTEVGLKSNIVQCTISDNDESNAINCVSIAE